MLTSFFATGYMKTTDAKAKVLVSEAEKLISLIRDKSDMNAIRELKRVLFTEEASRNALEFATKSDRKSGFVRRTKVGQRAGDGALISHVELIIE